MIPDIHMIVAGDAILQGFSRILLDLLLNLLCKFFLFPVAPVRSKSQKLACRIRAQLLHINRKHGLGKAAVRLL